MIPAGGSGKLTAKIKINPGLTGTHTKSITVQTDAPQSAVLRLSLAYKAVTPISVKPNFRLYLSTVEDEPGTARVLLHREDGESLEARIVSVSPATGLKVGIEAVADGTTSGDGAGQGAEGDLWLVAETLGGSRSQNQNGVVVVATNHPQVPKLEIPIVLRIRPLIDVRPNAVKLWPAEGGPNGTSANIRLSHSSRTPFEITNVEVSDPGLFTARVTSQAGQPIQAVVVTLAEAAAPVNGTVRGTVRITTSVEGREPIDVPVMITDQHEALRRRPPSLAAPANPTAPAGPGDS